MNIPYRKLKVVFTFNGGGTLTIKCKEFSSSKLSGTKGKREVEIKGADRIWSIDMDEVVAITATQCFF